MWTMDTAGRVSISLVSDTKYPLRFYPGITRDGELIFREELQQWDHQKHQPVELLFEAIEEN